MGRFIADRVTRVPEEFGWLYCASIEYPTTRGDPKKVIFSHPEVFFDPSWNLGSNEIIINLVAAEDYGLEENAPLSLVFLGMAGGKYRVNVKVSSISNLGAGIPFIFVSADILKQEFEFDPPEAFHTTDRVALVARSIEKGKDCPRILPTINALNAALIELSHKFPSLRGVPGIEPWEPFVLDQWLSSVQEISLDALFSGQFVLSIWGPNRKWQSGQFDINAALKHWDSEHLEAFNDWKMKQLR